MLAAQVRSGLTETYHEGAAAVFDPDAGVVAQTGDIDRPFFIRSSAKPFQAHVSQEAGAGLEPLELAMACASHRGLPVHIALVSSMLEKGGLTESALQCPFDWPLAPSAMRLVAGDSAKPRRIWHNCSGKHAGFLRACAAQGWPVETYLDPGHPLQRRVIASVSELGGYDTEPVGVDGCGAPVLRTTVRAMATMFGRLATDTRLAEVLAAMHRYPALVGVNGSADTEVAIAANGAAKGGAAGCIGVAVKGRLGIAAKSWDGNGTVAGLAAAAIVDEVGGLSDTARARLAPILSPVVLGGGLPQGLIERRLQLEMR